MKFVVEKIYIEQSDMGKLIECLYKIEKKLKRKHKKEIVYIEYNIYNKIEIQSLEYSIDNINYSPVLISGFELQSLMKKCGLKITKT